MHAQHFCFGLGAFSSPLILMFYTRDTMEITGAMWTFSLILAVAGVILLVLPSPTVSGSSSEPENDSATRCGGLTLTKREWMVVGATASFLGIYVGIEVAAGGFLYTYAVQHVGLKPGPSQLLTSVYWGSIAAGRLLSTIGAAYKAKAGAIIRFSIVGAVLSSLLLCTFPTVPPVLWTTSCLFGLSLAPIFGEPTLQTHAPPPLFPPLPSLVPPQLGQ